MGPISSLPAVLLSINNHREFPNSAFVALSATLEIPKQVLDADACINDTLVAILEYVDRLGARFARLPRRFANIHDFDGDLR